MHGVAGATIDPDATCPLHMLVGNPCVVITLDRDTLDSTIVAVNDCPQHCHAVNDPDNAHSRVRLSYCGFRLSVAAVAGVHGVPTIRQQHPAAAAIPAALTAIFRRSQT